MEPLFEPNASLNAVVSSSVFASQPDGNDWEQRMRQADVAQMQLQHTQWKLVRDQLGENTRDLLELRTVVENLDRSLGERISAHDSQRNDLEHALHGFDGQIRAVIQTLELATTERMTTLQQTLSSQISDLDVRLSELSSIDHGASFSVQFLELHETVQTRFSQHVDDHGADLQAMKDEFSADVFKLEEQISGLHERHSTTVTEIEQLHECHSATLTKIEQFDLVMDSVKVDFRGEIGKLHDTDDALDFRLRVLHERRSSEIVNSAVCRATISSVDTVEMTRPVEPITCTVTQPQAMFCQPVTSIITHPMQTYTTVPVTMAAPKLVTSLAPAPIQYAPVSRPGSLSVFPVQPASVYVTATSPSAMGTQPHHHHQQTMSTQPHHHQQAMAVVERISSWTGSFPERTPSLQGVATEPVAGWTGSLTGGSPKSHHSVRGV